MNIAYTMAPGPGDTDLLLFNLAQDLMERGYRPCGTVQINTECEGRGPCDMDVKVLPNGPILRISQSLGGGAKGCRLDPSALESAVGLVESKLDQGSDFLIVNKFGKSEADGRGFRQVIAEAMSRGIPVLVGLNRLNQKAFLEFTADYALNIEPDLKVLRNWLESSILVSTPLSRASR